MEKIYDLDETADHFRCCKRTIYNLINDGKLKSFKLRDRRLFKEKHITDCEKILMEESSNAYP